MSAGLCVSKNAEEACLDELNSLKPEAATWQYRLLSFAEHELSNTQSDLDKIAEHAQPLVEKSQMSFFVLKSLHVVIFFKPEEKDTLQRLVTAIVSFLLPKIDPSQADPQYLANHSMLDEEGVLRAILDKALAVAPSQESLALNHKILPMAKVQETLQARENRSEHVVVLVEHEQHVLKTLNASMPHREVNSNFTMEIIPAATLQEAMQIYFERAPDMVVVDEDCNPKLFRQFITYLCKHDPQSYIIVLTANTRAKYVEYLLQLGVKAVIQKPFSRATIQTHVLRCPRFKVG